MPSSTAGGSLSFKVLGVGWALFLALGMYCWLASKQGVGGPAFAMLTRTGLMLGAFRVAGGIAKGSIVSPRPIAAIYLVALLLIAWLGIASSAAPQSSLGFLSIASLYSRAPNGFIPELRQYSPATRWGEGAALLMLVPIFVLSLIAVIRSRARAD